MEDEYLSTQKTWNYRILGSQKKTQNIVESGIRMVLDRLQICIGIIYNNIFISILKTKLIYNEKTTTTTIDYYTIGGHPSGLREFGLLWISSRSCSKWLVTCVIQEGWWKLGAEKVYLTAFYQESKFINWETSAKLNLSQEFKFGLPYKNQIL